MLTRFKKKVFKRTTLFIMAMLIFMIGMIVASVVVSADTYYTLRINYLYKDGTPARDAYVAVYPANQNVELTVTNPEIDGFTPMTAAEGGVSAATTEFNYTPLDANHSVNVYYIAGLTHYRVLYYMQNLYDDLYTRNNSLPAELTDRFGKTGSNPIELEHENDDGQLFPGFTCLFHEPDAIAADGSTVFRVYYDRNYYAVKFDLGSKGYGLNPVYGKYQSAYHITEPKRMGYTFEGWLRTDKDSSNGLYVHSESAAKKKNRGDRSAEDTSWKFIDENGDELLDSNGNPIFDENGVPTDGHENINLNDYYQNFSEGTIPASNTYYKAIWKRGNTSYSVVYWFQNPDGKDLTADELNAAGSIEAARTMISQNYSVAAAKDIENVPSGTLINLDTKVKNAKNQDVKIKDFFDFDLTENGDFPTMSAAKREELLGKSKYYNYASDMSHLQFGGAYEDDPEKEYIEVMGDGTTRINVYYDRKTYNLKFYYARKKLSDGTIDLTNSTKAFSQKNTTDTLLALSQGTWQANIADSLPKIAEEYRGILTPSASDEDGQYSDYNGYRYYYYQVQANYHGKMEGVWLLDAITPVHKKGYADKEICYPGSWAPEYDSYHRGKVKAANSSNYTLKGFIEKLSDDLMLNRSTNYTELHFLLSWTNTSTSNNWNYGVNRVLHFTYQNYIELLPREIEVAEHTGTQALIDEGNYIDVIQRTFKDLNNQNITRWYGLPASNVIETIDSGDQYDRYKTESEKTNKVYSNQTASFMDGFELENYVEQSTGAATLTAQNTVVDWSQDSDDYRQATIKFFYHRKYYMLKWRNGNRLEEEHTREVMYGAPLNSVYAHDEGIHHTGEYRYWFDDPVYFNEDLRDYYNFVGWYYTPYYYRQVDKNTATMPADDTTLYARWDPKIINVSFYPTYNDFYSGTNRIGDAVPVHYGDYLEMKDIPANVEEDPDSLRPDLNPPTTGAMFAGWYYLRDDIPVRFDPEDVPITALNYESGLKEGARLRLYAEWATKDNAKYQVTYVEKDHPEIEVAPPTTGRAFVHKTKTFNAKGGSELNDAHAWTENGINWWPTVKSHSIGIKANSQGHLHEFEPNVYSFEYVQKHGVYYRVQYLDAASRTPLLDPADVDKDEVYTTHGSIKEDAPFIAGYTAEKMSQTLVPAASTAEGEAAQKAEELATNVLTFYYNKNDKSFVYEVEYYKQNVDDDNYTHYLTENFEVVNADDPETEAVEATYISLSSLFNNRVPKLIESEGFTRLTNASKVIVSENGVAGTASQVADNSSVEINGTTKTTIQIFYQRNSYNYKYQFVDYHAEQEYNALPENERDGVWNGVLEDYNSVAPQKVDSVVTIPVPRDLTYDKINDVIVDSGEGENYVPYTRISTSDVVLTIAPTNEENTDVNFVKVYYKKFYDRELEYKLACKNEDDPYTEVDRELDGTPLFGGLSTMLQTVDAYSKINDVTFYDFNDAQNAEGEDFHQHNYTFLGWYDNPEGTGEPLTTNATLTKEDLGLNEKLPERDTTYYAVVEQVMVKADFEFRVVDEELPIGGEPIDHTTGETENDILAAEIVRDAPTDPDGSIVGKRFAFSDPFQYENGSPLPYHKSEGYSVNIIPLENDNRVYKYEFSEWWEEDLDQIDSEGNTKLIRKKNWNQTDGSWAIDELQDQLDRKEDKHVIAVFKRKEITELPYTIRYRFDTRNNGTKDYVLKGKLNASQLNENNPNSAVTDAGYFELTDEFILNNAPYESNHGQTLTWTNGKNDEGNDCIVQTSLTGDGSSTEDRIEATVTAKQGAQKVFVHYRLTDSGEYTETFQTTVGSNRGMDKRLEVLNMTDNDNFLYWAIRQSPTGPVIAKCYDPWFTYRIFSNYYISPVFGKTAKLNPTACANGLEDWLAWTWNNTEDGELRIPDEDYTFNALKNNVIFVRVPKGTTTLGTDWVNVWNQTDDLTVSDGQVFTLTHFGDGDGARMYGSWSDDWSDKNINIARIDYSRNRWTDENGDVSADGSTDLLFSDYEVSFNNYGDQELQSSDYTIGLVFELCDSLGSSESFAPDECNYTSDFDAIDSAVQKLKARNISSYSGSYKYDGTNTRKIQIYTVDNADLTNKNRLEVAKYFKNSHKTVTETVNEEEVKKEVYTNRDAIMKVTAYVIDKDNDVAFSNSVYACLNSVGLLDLAKYKDGNYHVNEEGIITIDDETQN